MWVIEIMNRSVDLKHKIINLVWIIFLINVNYLNNILSLFLTMFGNFFGKDVKVKLIESARNGETENLRKILNKDASIVNYANEVVLMFF